MAKERVRGARAGWRRHGSHLHPRSATYSMALTTYSLLLPTLPRCRVRRCAMRANCAGVISMTSTVANRRDPVNGRQHAPGLAHTKDAVHHFAVP